MGDYIERESLLEKLHELGGCDADPGTWADGYDKAIDAAYKLVRELPAADVVNKSMCCLMSGCLAYRQTGATLDSQSCRKKWSKTMEFKKDYLLTPDEVDMVNRPPHYTSGSIECIDAMRAAFGVDELAVYCKIAAFKYIWRCEHKGGVEDIKKARFYLEKYIALKDGDKQ